MQLGGKSLMRQKLSWEEKEILVLKGKWEGWALLMASDVVQLINVNVRDRKQNQPR